MRADRVGAGEHFLHGFRPRIGSDVDVLGNLPAQQIAYATAREVGLVPLLTQPPRDVARGRFHERVGFHAQLAKTNAS